jgi:hypothetical protein
MQQLGLDKEKFIIIRSEKSKNKNDIDNEIFFTHYKVTKEALETYPGKNFVIFEDDCRVIDDINLAQTTALSSLTDAFSTKNQDKWIVINLGGVSLGPTRKSFRSKNIRYSGFMWAAHSYILNGKRNSHKISNLMKTYDGYGKWKRPYAVEGWSKFKTTEKWMVTPNITHQCVVPRTQAMIPLAKNIDYQDIVPVWNNVACSVTYVLFAALVVLAIVMLARMSCRGKIKK